MARCQRSFLRCVIGFAFDDGLPPTVQVGATQIVAFAWNCTIVPEQAAETLNDQVERWLASLDEQPVEPTR